MHPVVNLGGNNYLATLLIEATPALNVLGIQNYYYYKRIQLTIDPTATPANLITNCTGFSPNQGARYAAFTTPGTYTFVVPDGVTQVRAQVWGGGGGAYYGGGGAGGYAEGVEAVIPGEITTVTVGAGGNGATDFFVGNVITTQDPVNGDGGTSSFKTIRAFGGTPGIGWTPGVGGSGVGKIVHQGQGGGFFACNPGCLWVDGGRGYLNLNNGGNPRSVHTLSGTYNFESGMPGRVVLSW